MQEGDLKQAEKYADLAMSTDRYNPYGKDKIRYHTTRTYVYWDKPKQVPH